jgi:hypothetical protein
MKTCVKHTCTMWMLATIAEYFLISWFLNFWQNKANGEEVVRSELLNRKFETGSEPPREFCFSGITAAQCCFLPSRFQEFCLCAILPILQISTLIIRKELRFWILQPRNGLCSICFVLELALFRVFPLYSSFPAFLWKPYQKLMLKYRAPSRCCGQGAWENESEIDSRPNFCRFAHSKAIGKTFQRTEWAKSAGNVAGLVEIQKEDHESCVHEFTSIFFYL